MARNVVVCLEGAGGGRGQVDTQLGRLVDLLERGPQQALFHDAETDSSVLGLEESVLGATFGLGFTRELENAYRFLIATCGPGDALYLIGAGRGAYVARALAALLYKCGLLSTDHVRLVPQALKLFKYEERVRLYAGFRRTFAARRSPVRFLGLFDPLARLGQVFDPFDLPGLGRNPLVQFVRVALALDERRPWLGPGPWGRALRGQDVRQVWFAGAHADIVGAGSGAAEAPSSPPLFWMLGQARSQGVLIDEARQAAALRAWPPETLRPISAAGGRGRRPLEGALVHTSVAQRLSDPAQGYVLPRLRQPVFVDA